MPKLLPLQTKNNILSKIVQGVSINIISKELGIAKSTIYHHYKKMNGKKIKPVRFNFTDEDLGEFIGIFAGDGNYYYHKKTGHHRISIYTGTYEKKYAKNLSLFLSTIFSKSPSIFKMKKYNVITTRYNSKDIYLLLKNNLHWTGKKTYTVQLKDIHSRSIKFLEGFLRGLLDTDGNIYQPRNRVSFGSVSEVLMRQVQYTLEKWGFRPLFHIFKPRGNRVPFYAVSMNGDRAIKFIKLIKPRNPNKTFHTVVV